MNSGFSLLELMVVLTISTAMFGIIISGITEGISVSRKITSRQQELESLFFTVDTIKNDLTKCGMRLQEASRLFNFRSFTNTSSGFRVIYGLASDTLTANSYKGDDAVEVSTDGLSEKGRKVIIYDTAAGEYEVAKIKKCEGTVLTLDSPLKKDHRMHSTLIPLRETEIKLYKKQKMIKRKSDNGYFQPMIEGVTDFYISFFDDSNSLLYRLEINNREQVRGYIFLTNRSDQ